MDRECSKKDEEAFALKRQNEGILHDTTSNRIDKDRHENDNRTIIGQTTKQEEQSRQLRNQIKGLEAELDDL